MSHFTTIETQVRDIEALRRACEELDVSLHQNTEARGYASNARHGDYVIRLKGPYDIAVNRQQESPNYQLETDWWEGHVEKEVGANFGRLLQLYGVHKTIREARHRGRTVKRKHQQDGTIALTISA
jgi:hypothetical protein